MAKKTDANTKKNKIRDWQDVDIKERAFTSEASMPSVADVPREPHEILELFLNDEIFETLTKYTVMYSAQHGNHTFALDVGEMKVFVVFSYCLDIAAFRNEGYTVVRNWTHAMSLLSDPCVETDLTRL